MPFISTGFAPLQKGGAEPQHRQNGQELWGKWTYGWDVLDQAVSKGLSIPQPTKSGLFGPTRHISYCKIKWGLLQPGVSSGAWRPHPLGLLNSSRPSSTDDERRQVETQNND